MKFMSNSQFKTWLSYLMLIVCGIIAYVVINNLSPIFAWLGAALRNLSPFFAGIVIAYLLDIPCSFIERKLKATGNRILERHARVIGVIVSYAATIAIIVLSMRLLIPEIVSNVKEFAYNVPLYIQRVVDFLTELVKDENVIRALDSLGYESFVSSLSLKSIMDTIGYNSLWQSVVGILSVSSYLINATIAIVSSVYLLLEAKTIAAFFARITSVFIPKKSSAILFKYLGETNQYFKKFIYCTVVDGAIIGVASVVGLLFIDARYAIVLGIIEGVLNMVPYFGAIVGTAVVVCISLLTDGFGKAVIVLLFLFILQQIDGNVIKVKLYGDSFQISPFLVLFSITVGGAYYGVLGMVIAIPVVAVIKTILDDAIEYKLRKNAE